MGEVKARSNPTTIEYYPSVGRPCLHICDYTADAMVAIRMAVAAETPRIRANDSGCLCYIGDFSCHSFPQSCFSPKSDSFHGMV